MKKLILPILLILFACEKEAIEPKPDPVGIKPVKVTTLDPSRIGQAFATVGGKVENADDYVYAFNYGTSSSMMLKSTRAKSGSSGSFSQTINGLLPGTKYYYVAYVSYDKGGQRVTKYGEVKSFTTIAY